MSHFGKVAVLLGGDSSERDISLASGGAILASLQAQGVDAVAIDPNDGLIEQLKQHRPDRVCIMLHGGAGEGGQVQALLDLMGIPYTGSDFSSCAIAMDKVRSKLVFQSLGIATPRFAVAQNKDHAVILAKNFGFPVCIKPAAEGSSVGVSKVTCEQEISNAYDLAEKHHGAVMVERWIEGQDVFVTILDGQVLPPVLVKTAQQFYDFKAKYKSSTTKYMCPAPLSETVKAHIKQLCLDAFHACGCQHWGRVDLVIDQDQNCWVLEVNTVPGMTNHSLVPMAANACGISFDALTHKIVSLTQREPVALPTCFKQAV